MQNDKPRRPNIALPQDPTIRDAKSAMRRSDDGNAFVPDPSETGRHDLGVNDAEEFAEEFVASATAGQSVAEEALDETASDEDGGPFVEEIEEDDLPVTPRVAVPRVRPGHSP